MGLGFTRGSGPGLRPGLSLGSGSGGGGVEGVRGETEGLTFWPELRIS